MRIFCENILRFDGSAVHYVHFFVNSCLFLFYIDKYCGKMNEGWQILSFLFGEYAHSSMFAEEDGEILYDTPQLL